MPYRESLNHWIVVRQRADEQSAIASLRNAIVARFYRRADAEGHQQFLQQHFPGRKYVVMFDDSIAKRSRNGIAPPNDRTHRRT